MSMDKGSKKAFDDMTQRAFNRAIEKKVAEITQKSVKALFEMVEKEAITRKDLKRAAGLLKEDHPELSIGLRDLARIIDRALGLED